MSPERHYSEEEISSIFEQAIDAQESARSKLPHREGLTINELQQIGAELGITAEYIQKAAARLDEPTRSPLSSNADPKFLGVPTGLQRIVELPRGLTDLEWDRLVVDLRETFQARGSVKSEGSLRQWTNGRLQALIEPSGDGYRLRFRSTNANYRDSLYSGALMAVIGVVVAMATLLADSFGDGGFAFTALFLVMAVVMFGAGFFRLPRWHAERAAQFVGIGDRLAKTIAQADGTAQSGQTAQTAQPPRATADSVAPPASEAASSRIDLDALPDSEESDPAPSAGRQRS